MNDEEQGPSNPEPSFAPTQATEAVVLSAADERRAEAVVSIAPDEHRTQAPGPHAGPAASRLRFQAMPALRRALVKARTAAQQGLSFVRRSRPLRPENRGRAALIGLVVLLAAALAWRSVSDSPTLADEQQPPQVSGASRDAVEDALQRGDSVTVLALLAEDDSALALMLRADAATKVGRPAETFELLERAARVDPSVRKDPAFVRGGVASLTAVSSTRVATLLRDSPHALVVGPLEAALRSPDYRQRHGAQYVLAQRGHKVDDTPLLFLDLMQLGDCDAKAAVAKTLLRRIEAEPSVEPVLLLAKSRDRDGCLASVGPKRTQASR